MTLDHSDHPSLSRPEEELLTTLWRRSLSEDRPFNRDRLQPIARQIGRTAFESAWLAEQLIVAVKATCIPSREMRGPIERQRLRWVMSETISLCIEEFYLALHESEVRNRQTKSRRNSGEQPVRVS